MDLDIKGGLLWEENKGGTGRRLVGLGVLVGGVHLVWALCGVFDMKFIVENNIWFGTYQNTWVKG